VGASRRAFGASQLDPAFGQCRVPDWLVAIISIFMVVHIAALVCGAPVWFVAGWSLLPVVMTFYCVSETRHRAPHCALHERRPAPAFTTAQRHAGVVTRREPWDAKNIADQKGALGGWGGSGLACRH